MSKSKNTITKQTTSTKFIAVPELIWSAPISSGAKLTYIFLLSSSESWNPGQREISKATGFTTKTIKNHLEELENNNLIKKTNNGTGKRNHYSFNDLKDWSDFKEKKVEKTRVIELMYEKEYKGEEYSRDNLEKLLPLMKEDNVPHTEAETFLSKYKVKVTKRINTLSKKNPKGQTENWIDDACDALDTGFAEAYGDIDVIATPNTKKEHKTPKKPIKMDPTYETVDIPDELWD